MAGIAGIDPADASLGSAAWAEWVVDGDLAHLIDPREMPKEWPTGYFPLVQRRALPAKRKVDPGGPQEVYHLNGALTEWAYQLTKDVPLPDNEHMKTSRARYTESPNAQKPPFVLKGDNIAGSTFWHGKLLDQRANDWVKYWTEGKGNYVTTAMEDSGLCQAMTNLAKAGKVDFNRVMVLRTASNLRFAAARADRGGKPRRGKQRRVFCLPAELGVGLSGRQQGGPRDRGPLGQVRKNGPPAPWLAK